MLVLGNRKFRCRFPGSLAVPARVKGAVTAFWPLLVPTTPPRPRAPWTDSMPFPACGCGTNWKFGWPCLFIFLECGGLYFHGIFSAVQRFSFKLQQEEKPVPRQQQAQETGSGCLVDRVACCSRRLQSPCSARYRHLSAWGTLWQAHRPDKRQPRRSCHHVTALHKTRCLWFLFF